MANNVFARHASPAIPEPLKILIVYFVKSIEAEGLAVGTIDAVGMGVGLAEDSCPILTPF